MLRRQVITFQSFTRILLFIFLVTIIFSSKSVSALVTAAECARQRPVVRTRHGDDNNKPHRTFWAKFTFRHLDLDVL